MPLLSLDPVPILETADSGLLLFKDNVQLNYNKIQDIVNGLDSSNIKNNSISVDDLSKVGRYYSLVGRSTNVAVTSGAVHTIDFDTVVTEDTPFFNNTSNTWTIPADGLWELHLHLTYIHDVNTATDSTAIWNIDGSLYEGTRSVRPTNSGVGAYSVYLQPLNAGQVVTPQGFIVATNPLLAGDVNTLRYTRAMVSRVGPKP